MVNYKEQEVLFMYTNEKFMCMIENEMVDLTPVVYSIQNKTGNALTVMMSLHLKLNMDDMLTIICYISKMKSVPSRFYRGDLFLHGKLISTTSNSA